MDRDTVTLAQLEVSACTAELYLNGVPVLRLVSAAGSAPAENVAVEQLLVPGRNTLELLVEPGPTPGTARSAERDLPFHPARSQARLIRVREDEEASPGNGTVLMETSFTWSDSSAQSRRFPVSSSAIGDLGLANGRWPWLEAPSLAASKSLDEEARAVLNQLADAARAGSIDRFWELSRLATTDVLRAYPAMTESSMREELAGFLAIASQSEGSVVVSSPDAQDFRLVGGSRLLELVDKDWTPSLKVRTPGRDSATGYPIFLARIGGILRIVR
ncbi:MAG: hypothetical protein IPK33_03030 [Gemmatimonadetes bacterium]|nr:hypothetical protein [Gemmatimonadota bacterium]